MLKVQIEGKIGSFEIAANFTAGTGVTALFGPSGAGKSSILRAIAGLWKPKTGHIEFSGTSWFDNGQNIVPTQARKIGCVFQKPLLFPHLDASHNLLFGAPDGSSNFSKIVDLLDLGDILHRYPKNLSGGEAQRIAIGRALMLEPKLLLLDEPLTGLDKDRREAVFPYLETLCSSSNIPIIYVSHNADEIVRLADRVLMVDSGTILSETSPKDLKL